MAFLPLEIHYLLNWEQISTQFYSIAETYWQKLWSNEHPSVPLKTNHRSASIQISKYLNKCEKKEIKVVLSGPGGVGKSALVLRLVTNKFVPEFDPTM